MAAKSSQLFFMRDLHQIKHEILNAGREDVLGEWTIEDLVLFHSSGPFSDQEPA